MFFEELSPFLQQISQNPVAFLGGFAAGLLHLDLNQEPVKSWLEKQGVDIPPSDKGDGTGGNDGNGSGPQSISID